MNPVIPCRHQSSVFLFHLGCHHSWVSDLEYLALTGPEKAFCLARMIKKLKPKANLIEKLVCVTDQTHEIRFVFMVGFDSALFAVPHSFA